MFHLSYANDKEITIYTLQYRPSWATTFSHYGQGHQVWRVVLVMVLEQLFSDIHSLLLGTSLQGVLVTWGIRWVQDRHTYTYCVEHAIGNGSSHIVGTGSPNKKFQHKSHYSTNSWLLHHQSVLNVLKLNKLPTTKITCAKPSVWMIWVACFMTDLPEPPVVILQILIIL